MSFTRVQPETRRGEIASSRAARGARARHGGALFLLVFPLLALVPTCKRTEKVQGFPDSFVGVGLELRVDGDYPSVVRALPGGPAEAAGVLPDDQITAIDNQSTKGLSLGDVVMRLRGEPGSQVTLVTTRKSQRIVIVVRRTPMQRGTGDYRPTASP